MKKALNELQAKGAHGSCAVARIVADNEQGFTEINEHDFDAEKGHVLFKEKPGKKADGEKPREKMTKTELGDALAALGIEFSPSMSKDELLALFPA